LDFLLHEASGSRIRTSASQTDQVFPHQNLLLDVGESWQLQFHSAYQPSCIRAMTGRLPILLQMLERAEPAAEKDSYGDGLVRVLVEMDKPSATSRLAALARAGNLRAAQVLAQSKNDSVRAPLTDLANKSSVSPGLTDWLVLLF
jgi:hypothetical protein